MTLVLAILAGLGLGYVIERGDFCFHSTLRSLVQPSRPPNLFRAYLLALLIAVPLVQGMIFLGWIAPWVPPFAWQANVLGGFIFGIGMVVAATCITGLFYKLGHGMLGTLVGLAAWVVGDVATYLGPLTPLSDALNASQLTVNRQNATLANVSGPAALPVLIILGVVIAVYLWRSPRNDPEKRWGWLRLGAAVGLFTSLAWLLARAGGANYTYGTSRVPTGAFEALIQSGDGGSLWIPVALVSLVPGAFLAAWLSGTLWIRGETLRRYVELGVGGFLMGVGAAIAGGCNLGHSLVGVPLLSLGSLTTTLFMIMGVFLADRAIKLWASLRPRPAPAVETG